MSVNRVKFTDPRTATVYTWPTNPPWDAESGGSSGGSAGTAATKQRNIDRTSSTNNVGLVKQQGDDGPYVIHWDIEVFTQAHEQELWAWYVLSDEQTIYLTDWNLEEYEGQIVTLGRQRLGAIGGPGDTNARKFYCKYVFEFEVYRFITGPLASAGVRP